MVYAKVVALSFLASSVSAVQHLQAIANHDAPNGFGPSSQIVSNYGQATNGSTAQLASFQFDVSTPGVSTGDVGAVSAVSCSNGSVALTVPDAAHYKTATSWAVPLTLFVTNNFECNGQKTNQLFHVTSVKGQANNTVVLGAQPAELKQFAKDFSLNLDGPPANSTLAKRYNIGHTSSFPLNINSNGNGKATKQNMPIYSSHTAPELDIVCAECFTTGKANIKTSIAGSIFPPSLKSVSVTLDGNLDVNADISVDVKGKILQINTPKISLIDFPLTPISIPGVFSLGPTLKLDAMAGIGAQVNGKVTLGADMSFPAFHAELDLVNSASDKESGFSPKINPHKPITQITNTGVTGSVSLMPSFMIGFDILDGTFDLQAGIDMKGTLEGKMDISTSSKTCPNGADFSVSLLGGANAIIGPKTIDLYKFTTAPLYDQCVSSIGLPYQSGKAKKLNQRYVFSCPEGTERKTIFGQFTCV